ncbi:DUF2927 domain-containing protein [Roseovarius aestuariivivens]|uniref:DUF2927 domain-containing protein n=1 Tax=Roseovarius aestuariivivens TaxID=1888910 RepID=UPI001FDAA57E|nr:DUF2927 domain-containing protein [Roseovarius aestuariivivens]
MIGAFALAGCLAAPPPAPTAKPQARPAGLVPPAPEGSAPSAASQALTRYYRRLENDLVAQDLMRTGGGGIDTPYTDTDLKRNFERIAFYNEYQRNGGLRPSDGRAGRLKKWRVPIRIGVEFGANVPQEHRARDRANVAKYAARLARLTGHSISVSNRDPNFTVMIMSADDGAQARTRALEIMPNFQEPNLVFFSNLPRAIQCFVIAAGYENEHEYRVALAYIRSENTALQRLACIHEELAQGLGLANDSPRARPSIFNDDEEFALLTTHDEELLRILYNPALEPGMSLEEARPIITRILAGRLGPS